MREIKFRGKRVDNGEWVYGSCYSYKGSAWVLPNAEQGVGKTGYAYLGRDPLEIYGAKSVIPETVGQYTGLKDKNGKEIYEGDVIRHPKRDLRTVVFEKGAFLTKRIKKEARYEFETYFFYEGTGEDWEVIGAIHDNPELLKGDAE